MNCPACGHAMTETTNEGVTVDVCSGGCGGIWFDNFELKKVDEPHEGLGQDLMHVARNPEVTIKPNEKRHCPRCEAMPMMQHFASVKGEVTVDECPNCAGFFLDHGELNLIRDQYQTEDQRRHAAESLFQDLFGGEFEEMEQESQARLEKVRRLANMFRFLLPSYYIPGRQKWGAF